MDFQAVEALELKPLGVLLARTKPHATAHEGQQLGLILREWLDGRGRPDVGVLVVEQGADVQTLDEARMNELGWFRKVENRGYTML